MLLMAFSGARPIQQDQDSGQFKPTKDATAKDGFYIPKDLDDALNELDKAFDAKEKGKIMAKKDQEDMVEYHMGLGMWLRNNWGLWAGSRLYASLYQLGLSQPDDMSNLIMEEYWRKLHGLPLDTAQYVKKMQSYWVANAGPMNPKCPWDGSPVEFEVGLMGREAVPGFKGMIWSGRCKHGHLWSWFYKKGWYRPEGKVLKEIHDSEAQQKADECRPSSLVRRRQRGGVLLTV